MTEKRKALGRGLETLLPPRQISEVPFLASGGPPAPGEAVLEVLLADLDPNPYQTRSRVDQHALDELRESVAALGVLEPIIVRSSGDGRYQVVAGERRVKASQMCGKDRIPAVVRQLSDQQAMEMTIVENLLREDISALDTAHAFQRLSLEFKLSQEDIAARTGKDRASVANFMRLVKLPPEVQELLREDKLSFGHAKVLMAMPLHSPAMVVDVARQAVHLSVRQTEKLVEQAMRPGRARGEKQKKRRVVDANVREAEEQLQRALGVRVTITDRNGQGRIVLEYASLEDFDRILEALTEG